MKPFNLNKILKLLLFIALFLLNCKKNETVSTTTDKKNSIIKIEKSWEKNGSDSSKINVIADHANEKETVIPRIFRAVDDDSIIRIISAEVRPFKISDELTTDHQNFILKIKNFKAKQISGIIKPESNDMNIRFNQMKLQNGDFDSPFGRKSPEILLVTGKFACLLVKV